MWGRRREKGWWNLKPDSTQSLKTCCLKNKETDIWLWYHCYADVFLQVLSDLLLKEEIHQSLYICSNEIRKLYRCIKCVSNLISNYSLPLWDLCIISISRAIYVSRYFHKGYILEERNLVSKVKIMKIK